MNPWKQESSALFLQYVHRLWFIMYLKRSTLKNLLFVIGKLGNGHWVCQNWAISHLIQRKFFKQKIAHIFLELISVSDYPIRWAAFIHEIFNFIQLQKENLVEIKTLFDGSIPYTLKNILWRGLLEFKNILNLTGST